MSLSNPLYKSIFLSIAILGVVASSSQTSSVASTVPTDSTKTHMMRTTDSTSTVTITTFPDSVTVIIDEVIVGKSPITLKSITSGNHYLTLVKKGFFLKKVLLSVTPGKDNNFSFELIKPAQLIVTSEPAEATLFLDQEHSGTTPFFSDKIKPADYTLTIRKSGYEDTVVPLKLANGSKDSIHITLKKSLTQQQTPLSNNAKQPSKVPDDIVPKTLDTIAIATFVVFSAIILLIELTQGNN